MRDRLCQAHSKRCRLRWLGACVRICLHSQGSIAGSHVGERMGLRMRIYEREPIAAALRRFRKLLERSGQTKELRKRQHYEKP